MLSKVNTFLNDQYYVKHVKLQTNECGGPAVH